MSESGYALVGLTALVAIFVAVVTFALLRFIAAARDTRKNLHRNDNGTALLAAALQEAVAKLKAQERVMSARAAASQELSDQIVASITAGLLVVDRDRRIEIANPASMRLLGLPADAKGRLLDELAASVPSLVGVITECLQTGHVISRRAIQLPEGMPATHLGVTVSPLGQGAGVICLFADLSKVVELEEQLRLKDALAQLGELTAGIAHEFRNGLATIHGYSRLIKTEALPEQYRPYVDAIRQETEALRQVVTNFLTFARPEQVVLAPVDLRAIATRAADDLQNELPAGTEIDIRGEFAPILGDEVMLRQMFGNLLRNAAEACDAAGRTPSITITGEDDRPQSCRVVVEDNGPGIPDVTRPRIFQPFFTTRAQGTGLGLAIVQKIVVTHGGRIAAGRAKNGGASFEITLPALAG